MVFVCIIIMCLVVSGCGFNWVECLNNNIAEKQLVYYEGEGEIGYISLVCGERESNYKIDGRATSLVDFGIITIENKEDILGEFEYKIITEDMKYSGIMQKNPFEDNYMADIGKLIVEKIVIINLRYNGKELECVLNRIDGNFGCGQNQVLSIVAKSFKKELATFKKENKFNAEVYIKLINGDREWGDKKMWYVNIVSTYGASMSITISTENGKVLAMQKSL